MREKYGIFPPMVRGITKRRLSASAAASPFLVVLYLNVEKLAEKHGWDMLLVNVTTLEGEPVISSYMAWLLHPAMLMLSIFAVGIAAGIWVDAWIRRHADNRDAQLTDLGERCAKFVTNALISSHNTYESKKGLDFYNRLWSQYLPIVSALEEYRFNTPPHGITDEGSLNVAITYCQFVGNLLKANQIKVARQTARNLTTDPNATSRIRRLRDVAQRMWPKTRLG